MGEMFPNPDAMPGLQQDDPALDEPLEFTQRTYNEISAHFLYFKTICHDLNAAKEQLHAELAGCDEEIHALQTTVVSLANRIKGFETTILCMWTSSWAILHLKRQFLKIHNFVNNCF